MVYEPLGIMDADPDEKHESNECVYCTDSLDRATMFNTVRTVYIE